MKIRIEKEVSIASAFKHLIAVWEAGGSRVRLTASVTGRGRVLPSSWQ